MDDGGAAVDFGTLLERVRRRLDVKLASIRLTDGATLVTAGDADTAFPSLVRDTAFHRHALAATGPLVVPDAILDERFAADPLVSGEPRIRFYASVPLYRDADRPIGLLSLFDTRPRSVAAAQRLAELLAEVTASPVAIHEAQSIARLKGQLAAQAEVIREQAAALAHSRKIFERASATAKIGVWECDLNGEKLTWTNGVYDIFEFPRGSAISRETTLKCYSEASRKTLETLRSRAIETCSGFTFDAEIITAKGNRRWMRLTATVESEHGVAVRIFGMKQDITEEKILSDRTRYLAEYDVMTGLANRSQFQSRLLQLSEGADRNAIGALLLVDLDGFKQVNDTFGHALGDECLKEVALRLKDVCHQADLVARIGGDEFAVLVGPQLGQPAIEALAATIVEMLSRPVDRAGHALQLGASVGIARGPAETPSDLFKQADIALYAAKAAGRRTFRVYG